MPCVITPSATSPATSFMRGPTAAKNTRGGPYEWGGGANTGVIRVCVKNSPSNPSGDPSFQDAQIARRASTYSRMRAAGCDQGELNRFSICRRTCDPNPSTTRPPEYSCSWLVVYAMLIGLRAKATAIPVPRDTDVECSAASAKDRNG